MGGAGVAGRVGGGRRRCALRGGRRRLNRVGSTDDTWRGPVQMRPTDRWGGRITESGLLGDTRQACAVSAARGQRDIQSRHLSRCAPRAFHGVRA